MLKTTFYNICLAVAFDWVFMIFFREYFYLVSQLFSSWSADVFERLQSIITFEGVKVVDFAFFSQLIVIF